MSGAARGAALLRQHLAALNDQAAAALDLQAGAAPFSAFKLDEDTVSFSVAAGSAKGVVNLSLCELSRYPLSGGLAFSDGSTALSDAVESSAPAWSEAAPLPDVVGALATSLGVATPALDACLAGLRCGAGGSSSADVDEEEESDDAASESEEATGVDYEFEQGLELQNSLLRLRHKWEQRDLERQQEQEEQESADDAAAPAPAGKHAHFADGGTRAGKARPQTKRGAHQIFSSREATRILCNELFELMKERHEGYDGIDADCVEHNIHQWRVVVTDVNADSPLAADLAELGKSGGCSHLELELEFAPDMHPFFPTWVKILYPRFEGQVAEAIMAHARFTLEGWDPMKPVKWVIRFVQAFLEQHGRVALKDPRNKRPAGGAATAYSRAEHALCRLQTLSGTRPRWAFENTELAAAACADVDLDRVRVLNFGKRKEAEPSRSSAEGKGGWTAGTGYGHGGTEGGPTWDVHATEKAAAQKDREMRVMWSALAAGAAEIAPQVFSGSCLLPLLWQLLHNGSLLDIGSHAARCEMYCAMLSVVQA